MDKSKNAATPETLIETNISGLVVVKRPVFADDRGSFQEVVRLDEIEKLLGCEIHIRQINKSSNYPGVLRGIHIAPWEKLVHCYEGTVYQVIVDTRKNSPTFGEVFTIEMGERNPVSVWVPKNCGNAFCVLGDKVAVYGYAVTAVFEAGKEICLRWNEPDLIDKIKWPLKTPIVSDRDKSGLSFKGLPI